MLLMVAYMILLERKIAGWIQDRIGPNRAGPRAILQPFCDGLKLLFKEDYTPGNVNRYLFIISPCIMMGLAVAGFAVVPFGGEVAIGDRIVNLQIARVDDYITKPLPPSDLLSSIHRVLDKNKAPL